MRVALGRAAGGMALAAGIVAGMALPASAHVTLHSSEATQGGSDALVSIRVPNEEDNATTTTLEVDFPADTPLIGVLVQPTPGWQFQVTTSKLPTPVTTDDGTISDYVSKVVWSGGSIPVGGYQDFNIDVSSLPKAASVELKALQTYSNGDIVRWIDAPAAAGQPDPPHPAPVLQLAPAAADSGAPASSPATSASSPAISAPAPARSAAGTAKTSDVNGAKTLSVVAIVIGALGLLGGAAALMARRRSVSPAVDGEATTRVLVRSGR
ncbi:MAG TPA: YcnI family protein [Acidimicrobiales bacterium]|nr:YcnI family protein [Acidimicrobiales bacterium]